MERDSFENQLRNKILQAELQLKHNSNKEKVWNAIQRKTAPRRAWYYAAASILIFIAVASSLYLKNDQSHNPIAKTKLKAKPAIHKLPKSKISQEKIVNEKALVSIMPVKREQASEVKPENLATSSPLIVPTNLLPVAVSRVIDEKTVTLVKAVKIENNAISIAKPSPVPEFTVQFKPGATIVDNTNDNLIITTLKKFKLKRDTAYFANAEEKQSTKMKLTFKKEN